MGYQPIENYGIIGDLKTVALVGLNGSIDFMCIPNFDSPSVFASMLDDKKGGYFQISPVLDNAKNKQLYIPDTNVLLTRFLSADGVGEITDFMPVEHQGSGNILVRRVTTVRGSISYRMFIQPRFNYAGSGHHTEHKGKEIFFESQGDDRTKLRLTATIQPEVKNGDGYAEFRLEGGQSADFILEQMSDKTPSRPDISNFVSESMFATINYWKSWSALSDYNGRWADIVHRSALVLKLLTCGQFGSMIASPKVSLLKQIGGKYINGNNVNAYTIDDKP